MPTYIIISGCDGPTENFMHCRPPHKADSTIIHTGNQSVILSQWFSHGIIVKQCSHNFSLYHNVILDILLCIKFSDE